MKITYTPIQDSNDGLNHNHRKVSSFICSRILFEVVDNKPSSKFLIKTYFQNNRFYVVVTDMVHFNQSSDFDTYEVYAVIKALKKIGFDIQGGSVATIEEIMLKIADIHALSNPFIYNSVN